MRPAPPPRNPTPKPGGALLTEGRRLVRAYRDGYVAWRVAIDAAARASDAGLGYEAVRPLEQACGPPCAASAEARQSLIEFVMRTSGRVRPGPPGDCIEMDQWPGAAALIDGVLWVVGQDEHGDAGEMTLTEVSAAGVVDLAEGGAR